MGFYRSYMLLLKPPFLMRYCYVQFLMAYLAVDTYHPLYVP